MFKVIDGSKGEGGGSVVRLAFAFSSLTNIPIQINKIRANRPNSGLRMQHLVGIRTVNEIFSGELSDIEVGVEEVSYKPGVITNSKNAYDINIKTAGSIALVIQVLQLALARTNKPIKLIFKGGATYGIGAPSIDYLKNVTLPTLELLGYSSKLEVSKHGFYPKGGAIVEMEVNPKKEPNFSKKNLIDPSNIQEIKGISVASKSLEKAKVAERQKNATLKSLRGNFPEIDINIDSEYVSANSPGSGVTLWTLNENKSIPPIGSSSIGKKGLSAEKVGKKASFNIINTFNTFAVVDEYLADQILPYIALNAPFSFSTNFITSHTKTNIELIEEFLSVKFSIEVKDTKKIIHVNVI